MYNFLNEPTGNALKNIPSYCHNLYLPAGEEKQNLKNVINIVRS